jgi:hypothetical protein
MRQLPLDPLLATLLLVSWAGCAAPGGEPRPAPESVTALRALDPPAAPGAMAPRLTTVADGVLLSWLEPEDGERSRFRLRLARLDPGTGGWSEPGELARGDAFFANWADIPGAAAAGGVIVAHWLEKLGEDTYAYGVQLTRSQDGGGSWQPMGLLHDDDSPQEHGFVSWVALPDGALRAFWLDGRAMGEAADPHGTHGGGDGHGHGGGAMQLRTARVEAGAPGPSELLDERVCECCGTDAALTARGPLVVYRGRSAGELRDIAVVRATADGWSAPTLVHADGWEIAGCPVNGPAVAAHGEQVVVAWFTGAENRGRVLLARSSDAGATFAAPVVIDAERPHGRVDVALEAGGEAWVSWIASGAEGAELRLRPVSVDGSAGEPMLITRTTAQRSAGFPRMVRHRGELIFAWVEDATPSRLRVAALADAGAGGELLGQR